MATPGTSPKGSQSIVEWLPLLSSIVQALSGMGDDENRTTARTTAAVQKNEPRPDRTAP